MTSGPSSPRILAPSVLEIDRSKYPFSSPLFEPETTNGLRIQKLMDEYITWSTRSDLSYFEVVGGKGCMLISKSGLMYGLYEGLDVGDVAVAKSVYNTQRSPEVRILEDRCPPTFVEVYISATGSSIGSPVYSDEDQEKVIAYQLLARFSRNDFFNAAVYFRYDFSTCRTTCLVFGNHSNRIQKRFQQVFPGGLSTGTGLPQQFHRDPFLVLSTIAAEYVFIMRVKNSELTAMFVEQRKETGIMGHLFDKSLRVSPSALPSRIKGLHVCNHDLGYFMNILEFQISFVAFLQRQHRIFNEFKTKVMIDGADWNEIRRIKNELMASQKVSVSLDLTASLLDTLLSNVRTMSSNTETSISIVQSMISQFDSRTNISIAHDLKKDSVAMKTVAGLTMIFLPGTFTATFFSMVFFHITDDPEPRLTVNRHWWFYVAVTIPLTALVLAVWLGWMRWKTRGMPKDVELEDLGEI